MGNVPGLCTAAQELEESGVGGPRKVAGAQYRTISRINLAYPAPRNPTPPNCMSRSGSHADLSGFKWNGHLKINKQTRTTTKKIKGSHPGLIVT